MVLNSIFPVFALIVLGYLLKKFDLTNDEYLNTSDRLIYFIFFPALLFWKIGGSSSIAIDWLFCGAAISAIIVIYLISCIALKVFKVTDFQVGSFSQSCYRFNTYIGMAIIMNALGDEGVKHFGILIGFAAIVSNPLILACIAGILYARFVNYFPVFIDNTLSLTTFITLPLALLSIGGSLTLKNFKEHFKLSLVAAVIKLVLLPITGYVFMRGLHVSAVPFKVGMIFFTLPTSTAIYVLSSQLNSDTRLASASIVLSTILSFFSLSIILLGFS
jgi:predicted permease